MTPFITVAGYWPVYLGFTAFVVVLLSLDLLLQRKSSGVSMRNAALWTAAWIAMAVAFGWALYAFASSRFGPVVGRQFALEYAAGYVVEKSLSVDNMFVFALVFRYFAVPSRHQHRVLFYGVLGAIVLRGIFIAAGAVLVRLELVLIAFGVFLIYSGAKLAIEADREIDPGKSRVLRAVRRFLPVTPELHGGRFFARVDGRLHATPLLIVVFFLESTDVLFAVDSVPAVFGVTREPFIVYSSNIFAILGLRSMFLVLAGALERFHVLKYGLAAVLVFVGVKMVWLDHAFGGRFPIGISLAIIAAAIGISIVVSLLVPKTGPRPGSLQVLAGTVCFVLSAAAILYAAGPAREWLPLPGVVNAGALPLYLSAACYALFGVLLFGKAGGAKRPTPPAPPAHSPPDPGR